MPLDHLVYGVPDVAQAVRWFAGLTGVEPIVGGRHAGFGTANYLIGLGPGQYLELIGPDPDAPTAPRGRPFGITAQQSPGLLTWAARTTDIDAAIASARSRGYDPGGPNDMSRQAATGDLLQWRLTPDTIDTSGGVLPFLIDWGHTAHPTASALPSLDLESFTLHTPDPRALGEQLDALGVVAAVERGERTRISAVLGTPNGHVALG